MGITVTALDRAAVDAAYRIGAAVEAADLPDLPAYCRRRFEAPLHHEMPGIVTRWLLAGLDGAPAGWLRLHLHTLDNTENASAELRVHPAYRRRGVGRALLGHGVRLLREAGCRRMVAATVTTVPGGPARDAAGPAFAAAAGAHPALADVRSRLDTTALDRPRMAALLAEARTAAAGYRTVAWGPHTPEEYVADVAYLEGRMMVDAPIGDLQWEQEKVDAERIRGVLAKIENLEHCWRTSRSCARSTPTTRRRTAT